ncbi:MAG: D-2-hydroxyacid dehydrogenase [Clostridia bacterium]|nr:D-2-hydroxyacid dehydrogenase [Clostridia bacterium]
MEIIILDRNTVTLEDIDFSCFEEMGDVKYYNVLPKDKLPEILKTAKYVICNKAVFDENLINTCEKLKYIGLFATGFNNVDLKAANQRNITVCNAPGYSTESVVQHTFALLLNLAGSIGKYDEFTQNGGWINSATFSFFDFPITEIHGKTLGIVGFGTIGKRVAQIADGFGMKVIVHTRTIPDNSRYSFVTKEELFEKSDFISLNCPLNEGTKDLVNDKTLALMKKSAYIINTSRGGVVNQDALARVLNEGSIAGAGLDVLETEPMLESNPLLKAKNCIITPHTAWASKEARQRVVDLAASNLKEYLKGNPVNTVNDRV